MIININEVISFQRFLNVLKKCFKKRWDTVGELFFIKILLFDNFEMCIVVYLNIEITLHQVIKDS
jgi:hypothetical protein